MMTPQPLHPAWMRTIDAIAATHLGTRDRVGDALVSEVKALSTLYTRDRDALRHQADPIAARLRFFLPRDLPKIEGPLCDLARRSLLPCGPTWRVLDLGAGVGTTSLGVATVAKRLGIQHLHVTAVEQDGEPLRLFRALAAACGTGELEDVAAPITLTAHNADMRQHPVAGPFDLIVVGLALNELFVDADTVRRRAQWVAGWLEHLSEHGSLILVEPALRQTSRALQQVRGMLESMGHPIASPCTHAQACPLLERQRDWCHQELRVPLPDALRPIARAAGLRFERLTWSHLIVRRDGQRTAPGLLRVVGGPVVSKGRTEWQVCGEHGMSRLAMLSRHARSTPDLASALRGEVLQIEPAPTPGSMQRSDKVLVNLIESFPPTV